MAILELLRALLDIMASGGGTAVTGIAAALAILTPVVQRYLATRRRVLYRVQHDSRIGLSFDLDDGSKDHVHAELHDIARLVGKLTIVVIRIRNIGGPVSIADLDGPLEFSFRDREIWNVRISDASVPENRDRLFESLELHPIPPPRPAPPSPAPAPEPAEDSSSARALRRFLPWRIKAVIVEDDAPAPAVVAETPPPPKTSIRFKPELALSAKEKFKLVVVLHEPASNTTSEHTKGVVGPVGKKRVKDERTVRRSTWPLFIAGFGALLAGVLVTANLVPAPSPSAEPAVECASGDLDIVGSSAFAPSMKGIADKFNDACGGARVTVTPTGSVEGVRQVAALEPAQRHTKAALSDGRSDEATEDLVARPVAVIVYTMAVNDSVGMDRLTIDQVRGIYAGRYRDWKQLRPGPSLPIRIVGRGSESGSRQTFEHTMLAGRSEGALTSDSCETANRPGARTILCERNSEAGVIDELTSTPGAVGYVDLPSAEHLVAAKRPLTVLKLGAQYPSVSGISVGYPFWTIEFLYTKGTPDEGTPLASFLDYLGSGTARAELSDDGYTPCVGADGQKFLLCQE